MQGWFNVHKFLWFLSWKLHLVSLILFWLTALLNKVFLAAYFSCLTHWIYHVSLFWPSRSLWTGLLPSLCFYNCRLKTSCLELLSGFFLYLWNLQASLVYVRILIYFHWFWDVSSPWMPFYFSRLGMFSGPSNILSGPLSFLSLRQSSSTDFFLMALLIFQRLPSWSISCFSLFLSFLRLR